MTSLQSINSNRSIFSSLSKAYIEGKGHSYFKTHFLDPEAYVNRLNYVHSRTYQRATLAHVLVSYQKRIQAPESAFRSIEKLHDPRSLVVVTGQQAGIFGGPLYTVYKALTAIKVARDQETQLGLPVVPIFWVASEDHDFAEVNHMTYIVDCQVKQVKTDNKQGKGGHNPSKDAFNAFTLKESVGHMDVNDSIVHAIDQVLEDLDPKGQSQLKALFRDTLEEDQSYSDWFSSILTSLLGDLGLVVMDPMDPEVRRLGSPFLLEALTKGGDLADWINDQETNLETDGYTPLIRLREGTTGLYLYQGGQRLALHYRESQYSLEGQSGPIAMTHRDLEDLANNHPDRFSTNVALRPLFQDFVLPTLAYVAGPGELAYYGQVNRVYGHFAMEPPIFVPRENFTLVTRDMVDLVDRVNIPMDKVLDQPIHDFVQAGLGHHAGNGIDPLVQSFKAELDRAYEHLQEQLEVLVPEIASIKESNKYHLDYQIDYLHQKAWRFQRKHHRQLVTQLEGIHCHCQPNGRPQERILGLATILATSGSGWLKEVLDLPYDHKHRILVLEENQ